MDKAHLTADALCDFAEGLMPPADRREAEAHLAVCAECRREAAAMQGYFREMSGLETLKAPDRFLTRVHARLDRESPWRRLLAALSSPRLLPVPLMGLAVVLVGVYFAFLSPRLAEEALTGPVSVAAPPSPEPVARLAKKRNQPGPAAASPRAGTDAAAESLPQVAMAPPKPLSPSAPSQAEAEMRRMSPARAKAAHRADPSVPADRNDRDDRDAAGKAASSRPQAEIAAAPSVPREGEALALAEPGQAQERGEAKAENKGAGGSSGVKERKIKEEEVVGWLDNPSAVYILGNSPAAGEDPVADQVAGSRGPADLVEDAPAASPATPAPGAEAPPVAAAKAPAESEAKAKTLRKGEVRTSETLAMAEVESDHEDMRQLEADDGPGYAAPGASSQKRGAPAAAPPATTPKPWAPLAYTLKARTGDPVLRRGLAKLGVKVLRQDAASGRLYELEVPTTKVIDLEAYLKGLGDLTHSTPPVPGKKDGARLHLTLKLVSP